MKTIYLNMKHSNTVETVDAFYESDFRSYKDFISEVKRCVSEYRLLGMNVYQSQRCTKDWNNK